MSEADKATARQIITDSFEAIQVYAAGEPIRDADMARGFEVLNDMLESWSNESLTTYATLEQTTTLIPGINQYLIGPGAAPTNGGTLPFNYSAGSGPQSAPGSGIPGPYGGINSQRPLRLRHGFGAAYILDQTGNRYPLDVITQDRWNEIGNIAQVNANVPMYLWYDPQTPWGVLNFFPIPNIGWAAFWDSYLELRTFESLSQELGFPIGYTMAVKRNLSLELALYYPQAVISQRLADAAANSKANVKRTNFRETIAKYDSELVSRAKATYNIYRDVGT